MPNKPHAMLADLTHDEAARQAYASTLRNYTMRVLDAANGAICDTVVAPEVAARGLKGRDADRAVIAGMEARDEHRLWQLFSQTWQDLIWHYCMDSVDRQLPALVDRFRTIAAQARGSLTLDPALPLPRYQTAADNHRFPGSYYTETCDDDVRQGAVLDRAAHTYMGNQLGGEIHDRRGHTLISHIRGRFPHLLIERMLDIGCQNGASTVPWARWLPQAQGTPSTPQHPCCATPMRAANRWAPAGTTRSRTPSTRTTPTATSTWWCRMYCCTKPRTAPCARSFKSATGCCGRAA